MSVLFRVILGPRISVLSVFWYFVVRHLSLVATLRTIRLSLDYRGEESKVLRRRCFTFRPPLSSPVHRACGQAGSYSSALVRWKCFRYEDFSLPMLQNVATSYVSEFYCSSTLRANGGSNSDRGVRMTRWGKLLATPRQRVLLAGVQDPCGRSPELPRRAMRCPRERQCATVRRVYAILGLAPERRHERERGKEVLWPSSTYSDLWTVKHRKMQ